MTVRVNKSAFNIREKLSELERPIGVKGNELMRAETAQDARDIVSAGRKNLIINGAMMVSFNAALLLMLAMNMLVQIGCDLIKMMVRLPSHNLQMFRQDKVWILLEGRCNYSCWYFR